MVDIGSCRLEGVQTLTDGAQERGTAEGKADLVAARHNPRVGSLVFETVVPEHNFSYVASD